MLDKAFNVLGTIAIALVITSLVLPGRQTPAIIRETFKGTTDFARVATGQ